MDAPTERASQTTTVRRTTTYVIDRVPPFGRTARPNDIKVPTEGPQGAIIVTLAGEVNALEQLVL